MNARSAPRDDRSRNAGLSILLTMVILAAAAAFLLLVWPGYNWFLEAAGLADDAQSAGAESGVNLSEVSDNPDAMYGQTVTISGGVLDIVGTHAVIIGSDTLLVGDKVLVVTVEDISSMIEQTGGEIEDAALQVTGEVRQFNVTAVEQDLDIDLSDDDLSNYETVLVAESLELNPPGLGPGDTERQQPSAGFDVNATISDITGDSAEYLGQNVIVSGEVENIISPHAFRFGDEMLLAVSAEPREDLFVEPTAYVKGTVREFNLVEIERELGIDLDDEAFADAEGETVIVVEAIDLVK